MLSILLLLAENRLNLAVLVRLKGRFVYHFIFEFNGCRATFHSLTKKNFWMEVAGSELKMRLSFSIVLGI